MGFAIQIKFNPLGSYVLGILGNSRYAMWVNSYDASISNHLLKKPWFREDRWLGRALSVHKGRADTWMCVFKVSASSWATPPVTVQAFHSSLRDDMHYGPWSLSLARDSEPYCPWTYLNSCFSSKRRDLTKGISVKVWQRDLGNSYIIDFPSAFCLASPTYGSKVPHGP